MTPEEKVRISRYKTIESTSVGQLDESVNEYIDDGWNVVGFLTVAHGADGRLPKFLQTLVKFN